LYDSEIERLVADREKVRKELESARDESIKMLTLEKEELIAKYENEKQNLYSDLALLNSDKEGIIYKAENDKQQVIFFNNFTLLLIKLMRFLF
jgi:hypothetical protein